MIHFVTQCLEHFVNSNLFTFIIPIIAMFILIMILNIISYLVRGKTNV